MVENLGPSTDFFSGLKGGDPSSNFVPGPTNPIVAPSDPPSSSVWDKKKPRPPGALSKAASNAYNSFTTALRGAAHSVARSYDQNNQQATDARRGGSLSLGDRVRSGVIAPIRSVIEPAIGYASTSGVVDRLGRALYPDIAPPKRLGLIPQPSTLPNLDNKIASGGTGITPPPAVIPRGGINQSGDQSMSGRQKKGKQRKRKNKKNKSRPPPSRAPNGRVRRHPGYTKVQPGGRASYRKAPVAYGRVGNASNGIRFLPASRPGCMRMRGVCYIGNLDVYTDGTHQNVAIIDHNGSGSTDTSFYVMPQNSYYFPGNITNLTQMFERYRMLGHLEYRPNSGTATAGVFKLAYCDDPSSFYTNTGKTLVFPNAGSYGASVPTTQNLAGMSNTKEGSVYRPWRTKRSWYQKQDDMPCVGAFTYNSQVVVTAESATLMKRCIQGLWVIGGASLPNQGTNSGVSTTMGELWMHYDITLCDMFSGTVASTDSLRSTTTSGPITTTHRPEIHEEDTLVQKTLKALKALGMTFPTEAVVTRDGVPVVYKSELTDLKRPPPRSSSKDSKRSSSADSRHKPPASADPDLRTESTRTKFLDGRYDHLGFETLEQCEEYERLKT